MTSERSMADVVRWKLRRFIGHRDYTPFLVGTRSRTGSYMLISMLQAHPAIHAEGELCGRLNGRSVDRVLKRIHGRYPRRVKAAGFKAFYYHPLDDDSGRLWQLLLRVPGLRIIHLTRRNVLRTLLSRKIAGQTDQWMAKSEVAAAVDVTDRRVAFAVDELRAQLERTARWQAEFRERFRDHPVLELVYEDLVADPALHFGNVTRFLGVEPVEPRTSLRRQNAEALPELILNYDELKSAFAGSEWAHFFED